MAVELDTSKVWNNNKGEFNINNPWTRKEDLPGYSYKTSYQYGLCYQMSEEKYVEVIPLQKDAPLIKPDYQFKEMQYRTTSGSAYTRKNNLYYDPINLANRIAGTKSQFIKEYAEKLMANPPNHPKERISEFKEHYTLHSLSENHAKEVKNLKQMTLCELKGIARDEQPGIDPEKGGVNYQLDPYHSVAHSDYHYMSREKVDQYRGKILEPRIPVYKEPMWDQSFLRIKFLNRLLPKQFKRVPYSGMETETKASFGYPLDELCHKQAIRVDCNFICPKQTRGEVLAVPGMYHTEYNHMGTDWSLRSLV